MNELKQLSQFKDILAHYHVSEDKKKILDETKLMLFAAASSAGRNTIFRELIKTGHFHYIVSDTTRKPRKNNGILEQNGVEYWFKTEDEMLQNLREGKMLEAAIIHNQQVSGISMRELEMARDEGAIAMTDIEVVGTENIVKAKPDTMCLFIIPPSFEVWQKRMKHRGEMDEKEFCRRLESAVVEFEAALEKDYYWIIVNDSLDDTVGYIERITQRNTVTSEERQMKNRETLKKLLEDTREFLKTHIVTE